MFGFFKKECIGCGVKLPKDFKIIDLGYCSEKCVMLCFEVHEFLDLKYIKQIELDSFQQRRLDSLREQFDENFKKMKIEFENKWVNLSVRFATNQ